MSSTFQTSGLLLSDSPSLGSSSDVLEYGSSANPAVNQLIPSGSKAYQSEISFAGLNSNVINTKVFKIRIANEPSSNWSMDLSVKCFSNTATAVINLLIMKSTTSSNWFVVNGQTTSSGSSLLAVPVISFDTTGNSITVQQPAAVTDDGPVYYIARFEYASGNNASSGLPIFVLT